MSFPVFRPASELMDWEAGEAAGRDQNADERNEEASLDGGRGPGGESGSAVVWRENRRSGGVSSSARVARIHSPASSDATRVASSEPRGASSPSIESTATLTATLKALTLTKIDKLDRQRRNFENQKKDILAAVQEAGTDQQKRLLPLLRAVKELDLESSSELDLVNMERWLEQSLYDASIPKAMLAGFESQLTARLDIQSRRIALADLYSRMLREWLVAENADAEAAAEEEEMVEEDAELEAMQNDRIRQLRERFEAVVFTPLETDKEEIQNYLETLFDTPSGTKALSRLRSSCHLAANDAPFNHRTLIWTLKSLLGNDLLEESQRKTLEEFLEDKIARRELCDVLNMQYSDIKNWSWEAGKEGMPTGPRKQLNGKMRIMIDENVIQAIFLHYIGMIWSTVLKQAFTELVSYRGMWKHNDRLRQEVVDRRHYYLGDEIASQELLGGVEKERRKTYKEDFFMSHLPTKLHEVMGGYDGNHSLNNDDEQPKKRKKSPKEIKQQLLRQFATELQLRQALDGEAAIVQSDFQWFATGLSHTTLIEILNFIQMPKLWIEFFKKFLAAPLNLGPVSDDPSAPSQTRTRKRGVPMAHSLEKFFGEVLLFFMDLAVNQEANITLYRFHDDLWVCGQPVRVAKAWQVMERFAEVMGLDFNMQKTGSAYLTTGEKEKDRSVLNILPEGVVAVYFLILDPESGEWVIDQKEVEAHAIQLKKQLRESNSVLSWIATWNSCINRFFSGNFVEPANCFGRKHVDAILQTHKALQERIFDGKNGNGTGITDHIKKLIARQFGVTDIPDAFIFMPEKLGGLGVRNPFISNFLVRNLVYADPQSHMDAFLKDERASYETARRAFDDLGDRGRRRHFHKVYTEPYGEQSSRKTIPEDELDIFFSFKEYTRWRETTSVDLRRVYRDLIRVPVPESIALSQKVTDAVAKHTAGRSTLKAETQWLLQLYAEELFRTCGDVNMVDKNLLPLGILTMLKKKRVSWEMLSF